MDRIRWYPNERVQLQDFELATGQLVMEDNARAVRCLTMPRGRSSGSVAANEARIFRGFLATVPGGLGVGNALTLQSGKFVGAYLEGSTLHFGVIAGESTPGSYTLDFSLTSPGTYDVYVRFIRTDGYQGNRVFWNPAGAPAGEEVDTVYTRKVSTWEATFQDQSLAPPGNGEWIRVWRVTVAAGPVISVLTDCRHFFFEGSASSSDGPFEFEWGNAGTNDRNADRATYQISDLHWFAQMVRRQLADIIERDTVGLNATYVKVPAIDLASAGIEHYGPTEDQPGAHRFVTLYDEYGTGFKMLLAPSYYWYIMPAVSLWESTYFSPGNYDCPVETTAFWDDGTNRFQVTAHDPRGPDAPLGAVGDAIIERYWGGDVEDTLELAAVAYGRKSLSWAGTNELVLRMGASATARGLAAEQGMMFAKNGFMLWEVKTTTVVIPLQWAADVRSTNTGWVLLGDSTPEDSDAELYNCNELAETCRFFIQLPDNASLNYIDVMWTQQGAVSAGNNMRMYAQKHRMGFTAVGDKGTFDNITDFYDLNATQQYIEWAFGSVSNTHIKRFTANHGTLSNRQFDQHTDMLVLTFVAPNSEAKDCRVHWIRANFSYDWPQPYPVS